MLMYPWPSTAALGADFSLHFSLHQANECPWNGTLTSSIAVVCLLLLFIYKYFCLGFDQHFAMNIVVIFQMVILSLKWLFGGTCGCHSWLEVLLTSIGNRLGMWLYILQCMGDFPLPSPPPTSPTQQRIIWPQLLKVMKLENPDLEWYCWAFLFQRKISKLPLPLAKATSCLK